MIIWRRVITTKLGRTRYKVDKARGASGKRSIWPSTMAIWSSGGMRIRQSSGLQPMRRSSALATRLHTMVPAQF